jgi:hypothetical protein
MQILLVHPYARHCLSNILEDLINKDYPNKNIESLQNIKDRLMKPEAVVLTQKDIETLDVDELIYYMN